ncbi:sugar phosphate isomerase/epimerase family protein [Aquisphaera insulae]|uniref:sugar phosphate isomerase/epimerase family protein n=1 Tax=Aquisphaera insulae TaxID=2712864 RepID=UPI0013EADB24|nr:sugar phosphate isomerase/epimerase family protein [Aquisphaera insulae]
MLETISRRAALRGLAGTALVATAGAPASARTGADARSTRKFTKDLVCGAIGVRASLPEAIALAARHGYESVAPEAGPLRPLADDALAKILADLKAAKLVWGAAGLPVEFRQGDEVFRKGLKELPADAAALQRAGATRIGTWLNPVSNDLTYMANFRQHAARLREVAAILDDHGLRLGLEYVGPRTFRAASKHPFIHTMAEMRDLIAEINKPNVGLVLDSWHWYTAHETDKDILALKGTDVICCDLNDAPAGVPVDEQKDLARELPCDTGVIDVKAFLNALVRIGFDGPIRAEPFKADLNKLTPDAAVARTSAAMDRAFALIG